MAALRPSKFSLARKQQGHNTVAKMLGGSYSLSQLFLALCLATGLAAACVLLATAEPLLASTPAELRGGAAARRLSRGSSGRPSSLRRLSGAAAKGRRKADGPPPAGITVSYTPEEGYRSQEGQDKWVDQQIFGGKRCLSMVTVARAPTHCSISPPAGSGLLGPRGELPPLGCRRAVADVRRLEKHPGTARSSTSAATMASPTRTRGTLRRSSAGPESASSRTPPSSRASPARRAARRACWRRCRGWFEAALLPSV